MDKGRAVEMDLGPWVVTMEWPADETQGGPAVLVVRPADPESYPPGGLSSTVLRSINFREASARLRKQLAADQRWDESQERYDAERLELVRDALAKGISTEYLALLSSLYVLRVVRGQAKPVDAIAAELGKSAVTIQGHLWRARKEGLLDGPRGRKGGHLSKDALAIVERIAPSGLKSPMDTLKRLQQEQS